MILVTLAYMEWWTYVRPVDDVMAIKPRFLAPIGYYIFLTMVLRAHAPSSAKKLQTDPTGFLTVGYLHHLQDSDSTFHNKLQFPLIILHYLCFPN